MEPKNQERLERWLDKALAGYGSAEPRSGLEGRVLARVRQEQEASARTRSRWLVLAATAVAGVLAIGVFLIGRPAKAPVAPVASAIRVEPPSAVEKTRPKAFVPVPVPARRPHHTRRDTEARQDMPKLDQFPSPQPLSEQEKILARYVREYPEHAVLVARARAALAEKEQQELKDKMRQDSEQQDR
jgi:hypothetical protein